jgi:hypothetical protein
MRYLLFISIVIMTGCRSPYRNLPVVQGISGCVQGFKPVFRSELFNTQVNVAGKHLSGLLIIKSMPDSSLRMVFSNEAGFKYFDFEFTEAGEFRVFYVIRQMNKKAVLQTLRKDFELVLMRFKKTEASYVLKKDSLYYYAFPQDKEVDYYITDASCSELLRIEKASRRKTKVSVIMQDYKNGVPDTIGITHRNFNFNIGLKHLER